MVDSIQEPEGPKKFVIIDGEKGTPKYVRELLMGTGKKHHPLHTRRQNALPPTGNLTGNLVQFRRK